MSGVQNHRFYDYCLSQMAQNRAAWNVICASKYPELAISYITEKKFLFWLRQYGDQTHYAGDPVDIAVALYVAFREGSCSHTI